MARTANKESTAPEDAEEKTAYEILRDKRVAQLAERFQPINEVLQALVSNSLSLFSTPRQAPSALDMATWTGGKSA
jgi:hypothetical protein